MFFDGNGGKIKYFLLTKRAKGGIIMSVQSKEDKEMTITKESIIGDVLDFNPGTAKYFLEIGMHCLGCPSARGETIEQACEVHGVNCDELINKINEYLAAK